MSETLKYYLSDISHLGGCGSLVESHLKLVISIAKNYQGPEFEIEDLVQEGNIGLLRAYRNFNAKRGVKFSTYAYRWIKTYILRHIYRNRKKRAYECSAGEAIEEVKVYNAIKPLGVMISPEAELIEKETRSQIHRAFERLTAQEALIIRYRFGFEQREYGLSELGKMLGFSTEKVRQLEIRAFAILRKNLKKR